MRIKKTFRGNRFDLDWNLQACDDRGLLAEGRILNASVSGFRFVTRNRYRLRDKLAVQIDIPGRGRIGCNVTVVWLNPPQENEYEFGARFTDISESELQTLLDELSVIARERIEKLLSERGISDEAGLVSPKLEAA